MLCQLCRKNTKLIDAHIIPKWVFSVIDNEDRHPLLMVSAGDYTKRRPIGSYDSNILCEICDNKIGNKLDSIGKTILYDLKIKTKGLIEVIETPNATMLRYFLLSVLWRANIATIKEFNQISLGNYSDKIRVMLFNFLYLNKTDADIQNFTTIISRYKSDIIPDQVENILQSPYCTRFENGINAACLFFPKAIRVYIKIDKRVYSNDLQLFDIGKHPDFIPILPAGNIEHSGEFKSLLHAVHSSKN